MQGGKTICYNYGVFYGAILNCPKYGKELYTLVQIVKLKTFFVGKRNHH
jgi:hypothetical protein